MVIGLVKVYVSSFEVWQTCVHVAHTQPDPLLHMVALGAEVKVSRADVWCWHGDIRVSGAAVQVGV